MNVNMEGLKKLHGDKAEAVFREIARTGGFGEPGTGPGQVSPHYAGGLDVAGVLADGNTALSSKEKEHIAKLAGVDRGKATDIVDEGHTTSSKHKENK